MPLPRPRLPSKLPLSCQTPSPRWERDASSSSDNNVNSLPCFVWFGFYFSASALLCVVRMLFLSLLRPVYPAPFSNHPLSKPHTCFHPSTLLTPAFPIFFTRPPGIFSLLERPASGFAGSCAEPGGGASGRPVGPQGLLLRPRLHAGAGERRGGQAMSIWCPTLCLVSTQGWAEGVLGVPDSHRNPAHP
jgi:hypothetical protein